MEAALHARSLLAAGLLQPLSENSRPGHQLSTVALYPGIGFVNSNTAIGLRVCLYDDGRRSRSTAKERDSESGLDYFGARYYGSALGRFTSPDWSEKPQPVPYADLSNPQSLNQYVYLRNNPMGKADPDGHCDPTGISCIADFIESPAGQEAGEWISQNTTQIVAGAGAIFGALAAGLDSGGHSMTSYGIGENTGLNAGKSLASSTKDSGEQEADTVRQGKREAMRQEGIPTSQQPDSQVSTEGGRQAVYTVPKAGGGTETKVVTVNHNDSSHPGETHVEAGNAKSQGQTDSLGRLRVVNDKTKINIKKPDGQ